MAMRTLLALIGVIAIVCRTCGACVFSSADSSTSPAVPEDPAPVKWALPQGGVWRPSTATRPARAARRLRHAPRKVQGPAPRHTRRAAARTATAAPGVEWQKFSEGLRPDPPDLKEIVAEREPPSPVLGGEETAST